jgi:hypothetical protein
MAIHVNSKLSNDTSIDSKSTSQSSSFTKSVSSLQAPLLNVHTSNITIFPSKINST